VRFQWIEPLYRFEAAIDHIAVPGSAEATLLEMADELVGTGDLIAIYIPEGTDEAHEAGAKKAASWGRPLA
jgi:hypothetical protein